MDQDAFCSAHLSFFFPKPKRDALEILNSIKQLLTGEMPQLVAHQKGIEDCSEDDPVVSIIERLIKNELDPNVRDENGKTILHYLTSYVTVSSLKCLIMTCSEKFLCSVKKEIHSRFTMQH